MTDVGFSASGNCLVTFIYSGDNKGTETFSATSTGVTYIETVDTLKNVLSTLVNDFFASNPCYKKISVVYYDITCLPSTKPKLTLYYNLIINNGNIVNQEHVDIVTIPKSVYSGASNQRMTNSLYQPNSDIISFFGYRTPLNTMLDLPPLYNETVSILQPDNGSFVSGQKTYIDNGSSFASTIPFILFNITCSSGIFSNYS
jgi:hypothetical protein